MKKSAAMTVVAPLDFNWKEPDHYPVYQARTEALQRLREHPELLPALRDFYSLNPAQFIMDWGVTHDPRNPERGLPAAMPFVLFPKQVEFIAWVMERWRNGQAGICEKSRDSGVSWLLMALSCTLGLFHQGISIGIGSRKEDLLDRSGDPSSMFFKARMFMEALPVEFLGSWDVKRHAPFCRIIFPDTSSAVVGDAGDGIGRGGRTSIFFLDEAAFLERPQLIDASLAATTNCRIDVSTPNGLGNSFAQRRHTGKHPVFTFHWRDDPRKGEDWYQRQVDALDPVTVAAEIDIDYRGSVEGLLIPSRWVQEAIGAHLKLGIEPTGMRRAALDVADSGLDLCALAGRQGILLENLKSLSGRGGDIFESVVKAFDLCDAWNYEFMLYDADGLGSGVRGDARIVNERRETENRRRIRDEAFRGSSAVIDPDGEMVPNRKNKDFFANMKAQAWWQLRLLFQETHRALNGMPYEADRLISISPTLPELNALAMELSQPTFSLNSAGKIVIDKQPQGMRSPNLADAVMICFNPGAIVLQLWATLGADE